MLTSSRDVGDYGPDVERCGADGFISKADLSGAELIKVLKPIEQPLHVTDDHKPFVILVAGVNGGGKTTTIGKLAKKFAANGAKVMLVAKEFCRVS